MNYGGVRRQGRPLSQLPLSQRAHEIWGQLPQLIGIDGEYQRSGHLKLARSLNDLRALQDYAASSQGSALICSCLIAMSCAHVFRGSETSRSVLRCARTMATPTRAGVSGVCPSGTSAWRAGA